MSRNLQPSPEELRPDVFPSNQFGAVQAIQMQKTEPAKVNARAVELIARPDRAEELRACICEQLAGVLKNKVGFQGIFVMTSHHEPRLILVVTLWRTRNQATETRWETHPGFQRMVSSMVDVCARVQTYEALLPMELTASADGAKPAELQLC
jgi:heme-degrading monooxygenase HmoA